jgi:hypothetical protein
MEGFDDGSSPPDKSQDRHFVVLNDEDLEYGCVLPSNQYKFF